MTVAVLALLEELGVVVAGRTHPRVAVTAVATTDVVGLPMVIAPVATGRTTETVARAATTTRTAGIGRLSLRDVDPLWTTILPRVDGTTTRTDVIMALPRSRILTAGPTIALRESSLLGTAGMAPVKVAILVMTTDEVVVEVTGN